MGVQSLNVNYTAEHAKSYENSLMRSFAELIIDNINVNIQYNAKNIIVIVSFLMFNSSFFFCSFFPIVTDNHFM